MIVQLYLERTVALIDLHDTSQRVSTNTTVTYTRPHTLSSVPIPSIVTPSPPFPSRIPRPISPIQRSMSPRPQILPQTPLMTASTPVQPTRLHFDTPVQFQPPPPIVRQVSDASAQTPDGQLTLQERYPNVIIPSYYDRISSSSSQSNSRDIAITPKAQKNLVLQPCSVEMIQNYALFLAFFDQKNDFFRHFFMFSLHVLIRAAKFWYRWIC